MNSFNDKKHSERVKTKCLTLNIFCKMIKSILIFLCSFLALGSSFGQGYHIEAKFKGIKDSTCYLSYYFENQNYIQDSSRINAGGQVVFKGTTPLKGGIYNIMIGNWRSFDILIGEQVFSLEADPNDLINTLKFKGSRENDLYYAYQKKIYQEALKLKGLSTKTDSVSQYQLMETQFELGQYQKKFVKAFEGSFASKVIRASMQQELPPATKLPDGTDDPLWQNKFYVNHYFDNIDLSDERFIRSSYVYRPLNEYFMELDFLPADSLKILTENIIRRAKKGSEMRKYLTSTLTNHFEVSKTMGHDAVFVNLMQKHYVEEPELWDSTTVRLVRERVSFLSHLLIGSKIPELRLTDVDGQQRKLHDVKANITVLYIYGADCSHCQYYTPQLVNLLKKYKAKGLEVFAPIFGNNETTWKEFISNYNASSFINVMDKTGNISFYQEFDAQYTPTIYVLDKNKNIIAKGNMSIATMEKIISSNL